MKVEPLVEKIRKAISENSVTGRVPAAQYILMAGTLNIYDIGVLRRMSRNIPVEQHEE
jgi:hypothetical protein